MIRTCLRRLDVPFMKVGGRIKYRRRETAPSSARTYIVSHSKTANSVSNIRVMSPLGNIHVSLCCPAVHLLYYSGGGLLARPTQHSMGRWAIYTGLARSLCASTESYTTNHPTHTRCPRTGNIKQGREWLKWISIIIVALHQRGARLGVSWVITFHARQRLLLLLLLSG